MTSPRVRLLLLLLLAGATFVANNGALEANIMEARNLTTAREMLEKGNWLEPTMNGELRFEKPPLPTWATAVAMMAFGQESLGLLRLPAALAAMLLVYFLYRLARELTDDETIPFLAAATAATSFYVLLMARDVTWDVFTHAFMLGAIWQLHRGLARDGRAYGPFLRAGLLMGLSFLSKGPVAFFATLLPYLVARSFAFGLAPFRAHGRPLLAMAAITLAMSAVWPAYIGLAHPEFAAYVAQKEAGAWINRNVRPFWHYWSFPVQSGVWTVFATAALVVPYARRRVAPFGDRNYRLLAAWVFADVFLLSLFPEKKERYLLPVLLPLAILTAFYVRGLVKAFRDGSATRADAFVVRLNGALMALAAAALPIVVWALVRRNGHAPDPFVAVAGAAVFWPLAFLLARAAIRTRPFAVWAGTAALMAATCVVALSETPGVLTTNRQYRPYHELRHRPELAGLPFFRSAAVGGKFIEVVWASGREIAAWDPGKGTLPAEPPFVLLTAEEPSAVLGPDLLARVELEELGRFDAVQGRGGRDSLRNYVTVVRPRARLTGR
ncbi:MAG TPA: glycosyltransferase family 39 protein [Anaeromyxobacteraceae bacterium]|nr:glycosyltransferase family 39 protein [Anaeromyxobacteraceae bacterium]